MGYGGKSMITKHTAIRNLYPNVTSVLEDSTGNFTCKDKNGNLVSINVDDVNTEAAKLEYKNKRQYPLIQEQLDMQYWDKKNGTTTWVDAIAKVKSDNPKP